MLKIAHLLDDLALGGVTRNVETIIAQLGPRTHHERIAVAPTRRLPPIIDADVVVVHYTATWAKMPFLAILRAQRKSTPIVIVEHAYTAELERIFVPSTRRFRAMVRMAYGFADRVVAVSHGQADWIRGSGLVAPAKLTVIPSATDCSALFQIALPDFRPTGPLGRPLRLGAYGRYARQKGFDVLIEAMRRLPEELASLTLAGLGPDEAALKTAARSMANIEVGGPVTDLGRFLASVDAIVVPSRWEAFGQVAAEARAAGRPVIASAIDGLVEQVRPTAGLLVPSEDPDALAAAILKLSQANLTAIGAAGRQSAVGHLEHNIACWRALLASLTAAPVAASGTGFRNIA